MLKDKMYWIITFLKVNNNYNYIKVYNLLKVIKEAREKSKIRDNKNEWIEESSSPSIVWLRQVDENIWCFRGQFYDQGV